MPSVVVLAVVQVAPAPVRVALRALPQERPVGRQARRPVLRQERPALRRVPLPEPRALPLEQRVRPRERRVPRPVPQRVERPASASTRRAFPMAMRAHPWGTRRALAWRPPSTWA
jgi:hypothetical protein